jgi:hypothetical protein
MDNQGYEKFSVALTILFASIIADRVGNVDTVSFPGSKEQGTRPCRPIPVLGDKCDDMGLMFSSIIAVET